jgi:biotin operon repressor
MAKPNNSTDEAVKKKIRKLYKQGIEIPALTERFRLSRVTIQMIIKEGERI